MSPIPESASEAWRLIFGRHLHVGCFENPNTPLDTAAQALVYALADMDRPEPGCLVLDVGCGVGGPAGILAQDYECRVVGISPNHGGLVSASRSAEHPERMMFVCADGQALPFAAACFDLVWMMESIHRIKDKKRLFNAANRALKPDGRLLLCDFFTLRTLDPLEFLLQRKEISLAAGVFQAGLPPGRNRIHRLLSEAGFAAITFTDISRQVRPTMAHWQANLENNRTTIEQRTGPEALALFARGCRILDGYFQSGDLGYFLAAAQKPAISGD